MSNWLRFVAACPSVCELQLLEVQCTSFHSESIVPLYSIFLGFQKQRPHVVPKVHGQASLHKPLKLHARECMVSGFIDSAMSPSLVPHSVANEFEAIKQVLSPTALLILVLNLI
jgi:hypothetical protein